MTAKNQTPEFRSPGPTRQYDSGTRAAGRRRRAGKETPERKLRNSTKLAPVSPSKTSEGHLLWAGGKNTFELAGRLSLSGHGGEGEDGQSDVIRRLEGAEQHEFCLSLNLPGGLLSKETGGQMVEEGRVGVNKHQNSEGDHQLGKEDDRLTPAERGHHHILIGIDNYDGEVDFGEEWGFGRRSVVQEGKNE